MKKDELKIEFSDARKLSQGQLWRLKTGYVLIVALESLCVRFKWMNRPDELGERTLTGDCDTLLRYLLSRNGKLVAGFHP